MLCGEFKYIIHKHLSQESNMSSEQTIYLFVGTTTTAPRTGAALCEIYAKHKSEDGFLYLSYSAENTLGMPMPRGGSKSPRSPPAFNQEQARARQRLTIEE